MEKCVAIGIPTFHLDQHGFPLPGEVVRYYREHMTYTDSEGKQRRWTQTDLAKRLHVSELMVRLMETQHQGLNSIERRRTLALLLNIPPALLGLATLDDLHKAMQGDSIKHLALTSHTQQVIDTSEIQLYRDALGVFKDRYEQGKLQPQAVEAWIARITNAVEQTQGTPQNEALAELAKYHFLAANTYDHDLQDWVRTTDHLSAAKDIASTLDNNELFATACYYTSEMYLGQNKPQLAYRELEAILDLSKSVSPQLRGNILADIALTRAKASAEANVSMDEADRSYIRKLLDEAEDYVSNGSSESTLMGFNEGQYLETRASTLIYFKRYGLALECIDEAEEYLESRPPNIRNTEFLKILRAKCYIGQKNPEYEEATRLLSQVLSDNSQIQLWVDRIAKLHKLIIASPYGKAPDVTDLGMVLRKLRAKQ